MFSHELRSALGAIRDAAHLLRIQCIETPAEEQMSRPSVLTNSFDRRLFFRSSSVNESCPAIHVGGVAGG